MALILQGLAVSATAEERRIEEIIVTAEHTRKAAQDTPIAISAFDNKFMDDAGIVDIDDLSMYIPSMSRDSLDLTIRGIGRNFRSLGGDVGVPTYINGVYTEEAIALGSEQGYYDLERVEVLRGPQGTLYGRNAIGGVINYITNRPTSEFFAEVKARGGAYNTGDFQAVVSGPLRRNLLNYRLVAVSNNLGPDRTSRAAPGQRPLSDTGGFEDNNLALTLEYLPTDNIDITLRSAKRYFRFIPRVPVVIGEGYGDRRFRSSEVCYPAGSACFEEPVGIFFNRPPLNPNAHASLPVNGNGYGEDLHNVAYPDFKPDYGYWYLNTSLEANWRFNYERLALRYLAGYIDADGTYKRHGVTAPGGRNRCQPPRCTAGPGAQISAYAELADNPLRQHTHELQLVSNFVAPFNFVAGLYYAEFERELYYETADSAQLGLYTETPSYGLLDPSQFFLEPLGIGRHNEGINDAARFAYFGGTQRGAWFWMDTELDTTAIAAYLQANIQLREKLELTLGARWSQDKKTGREWRWIFSELSSEAFFGLPLNDFNMLMTTDPDTGTYNGDPLRLAGFPIEIVDGVRIKDRWRHPTWRVALNWQPRESTMIWGSVTTGYRSGGFNLGLHQLFPYSEEEVIAYETGFKSDFFQGRLRLNFNAYFYEYKDHQIYANQVLPGSLTGCIINCVAPDTQVNFINAVSNLPEAKNLGTETELTWRAHPNLTLGLIHSYMDTEVSSDFFVSRAENEWSAFPSDEQVNLKGGELTRAPRHKATAWVNYTLPLGERGVLNFLTAYAYTDEQYHNILTDRINEAPAYERWDFRMTWDSPTEKYRLTAYVKNITNELGIIQIRAPFYNATRTADTSRPRSWGIEFRMRFGAWNNRNASSLLFDGPIVNR